MPTTSSTHLSQVQPDASTSLSQDRLSSSTPSTTSELTRLKIGLQQHIRQYPDFPTTGVLFEDILPLFANHNLHQALIRALELHVRSHYGDDQKPDIVVGLEARGFLFGPSLALALGAGFVPVRKRGKLPGPTRTAQFQKEYGTDWFEIQEDSIQRGLRVVIVDDIIATGGSAAAAGTLVQALGGNLLGYLFLLELDFLRGREKLDAPVYTLLSSQAAGPPNS